MRPIFRQSLVGLDARLAAVLKGEAPKDNAERFDLGSGPRHESPRGRREALARGVGGRPDARRRPPCPAPLQRRLHRRDGCHGQGKDVPKPDDTARAKLRKQALDWLKAELSDWKRVSMMIEPGHKETVAKTLTHWKQDADLAGIRDTQELAKLPDAGRMEWQGCGADVDALLKRIEGTNL